VTEVARANRRRSCIIHHPAGWPNAFLTLSVAGEAIWRPAAEFFARGHVLDQPTVLIMDATMLEHVSELRNIPEHVIIVAADSASEAALGERADISLVGGAGKRGRQRALRAGCLLSDARLRLARQSRRILRTRRELYELNRIGMALMLERDENVLLHQILDVGKRFTESDAGCLLLLESDERNVRHVRLALCKADSAPDIAALTPARIPVDDTSIIGHAAATGQPAVIDDVYELPPEGGLAPDPDFERQFNYRMRSVLIVPMVDHLDRLVGVLVVINRKSDPTAKITNKKAADRYCLRYTGRQLHLARSLAGMAAVSIENARLYAQVDTALTKFVKAAVTAIDQRDPATAGHSVRTAALTAALAAAVERERRGPYREVRFTREQMRELYFAALVHDVGKIAVREDVLVKAKKLPPALWERVDARFDLIRRTIEVEYLKKRASLVCSRAGAGQHVGRLEAEYVARLEEIQHFQDVVRSANEPTILFEQAAAALLDIAQHTFERPDRGTMPYLTADELHYLQIPEGSLDTRERAEVEWHVEATNQFLIQIPWTKDLQHLATYAYEHHEKLDGTGYPRRLSGRDIPLQSRLLTIADIFDALTASDRPYKAAVSPDKALDILQFEARAGRLDSELVRILVHSQVYRRVVEEDWRHL
jgi:HD-GYP domain-containing protein (c-di-GMP phosphodiesterase class II)